jgi:OTT_1508-like deaminase
MLAAAVSMNQNRILCRMRSSHAKWDGNYAKVRSSKPALLPQFLETIQKTLPDHHMELICQDHLQLQKLMKSLETLRVADGRSHRGVVLLVQILKAINRLCSSTYLRDIYPACLPSPIKKLGHYVSVSLYLLEQARLKHVLSTLTVQIVRFEPIRSGDGVPSLEDLRSLFTFTDSRTVTLQVLECLNPSCAQTAHNNQSKVVLRRIGEIMRNKSPVHAEIQLLIHYELISSALPPRVIHCTKRPCFLCNLFFSIHGKFRIPATHGRLYEKWTLPADIANLQGAEAFSFGLKLAAFKEALVASILNCVVTTSKRGSGPAISSESFYLELPPQAFQMPVRQAPEEAIAKVSTTSLDRHHGELEVGHCEEYITDHGEGQVNQFPDEGGIVSLEVSNSTIAGSAASKKIFDRSVSACSRQFLDNTDASRSSRISCSPKTDNSATERKRRQTAPRLRCTSEKALCVEIILEGSDFAHAKHGEDIEGYVPLSQVYGQFFVSMY